MAITNFPAGHIAFFRGFTWSQLSTNVHFQMSILAQKPEFSFLSSFALANTSREHLAAQSWWECNFGLCVW